MLATVCSFTGALPVFSTSKTPGPINVSAIGGGAAGVAKLELTVAEDEASGVSGGPGATS